MGKNKSQYKDLRGYLKRLEHENRMLRQMNLNLVRTAMTMRTENRRMARLLSPDTCKVGNGTVRIQ